MAGLQVGRALESSGCLGLGSAVPAPHVPWYPTSICDEGVNDVRSPMVLLVNMHLIKGA